MRSTWNAVSQLQTLTVRRVVHSILVTPLLQFMPFAPLISLRRREDFAASSARLPRHHLGQHLDSPRQHLHLPGLLPRLLLQTANPPPQVPIRLL